MSCTTSELVRQELESRGIVVRLDQVDREQLEWEDFFADFFGAELLPRVSGCGAFGYLARRHGQRLARLHRQESRRRWARWRSWLAYLRHRRVL